MDEKNLNEIKNYIQSLFDKYLPIEERFSIKDFNEELTFILVDLLLEKDEVKRAIIYKNLYDKAIKLDKEINWDYQEIVKISNKIILWKMEDQERKELENIEKSFDEQLNNL